LHRANVATNGIRCSQNFCAPKATCRIVIPSREDGETSPKIGHFRSAQRFVKRKRTSRSATALAFG